MIIVGVVISLTALTKLYGKLYVMGSFFQTLFLLSLGIIAIIVLYFFNSTYELYYSVSSLYLCLNNKEKILMKILIGRTLSLILMADSWILIVTSEMIIDMILMVREYHQR